MDLGTRRKLLKTGLASALFAVSGAPVASSPRRGGCLRLAIDAKSAPHFGLPGVGDQEFFHLATYAGVFETLVRIAPDGMLRGELANEWRGSPDARIWSFQLCEGVRFHDGSPLVADHVVTALQGQLKSRALRNVTRIEAANRLEIRVALSAPDTGFPFLLCSPEFAIQIGANGAMPQGTGPYRVSRYRSGERLDAIRSGQAHHAGEGHFDRVQILTSGAQGHRVQLLRSGRVDALVEIAPALAPQLLSSPGLQVGWVRNARYLIFDMSKIAPKNLRRRLKNAVNSEAMLRDVLRGHGRSIFPGGTPEIKAHGPSSEIGITQGTGFDETAARLVACLAGSSVSAGISFCSGRGTHGSFSVRWAESAEALAVQASRSRSEVVVLAADAVGVVSDRLIGPVRTGSRLPLDDARIARRWWLA